MTGAGHSSEPAHMAVVEDGDGRLIGGVLEGSLRLVALHHRLGLRPEGLTKPVQLAHEVRHVASPVGQRDGLEALRVRQRPFLAEPGAPGLAQVMDGAEPERGAHGLRLLDIALDGPERLVVGPVGLAGAELVESHDPVALVGKPGMAVAQVVAGEPRPAVDAEQHLVAGAEAVGDDVVSVHGDVDGLVRRAIVHHGQRLPPHAARRNIPHLRGASKPGRRCAPERQPHVGQLGA